MTDLVKRLPVALAAATHAPDLATLRAIEDRVLWLSTAIVDHANCVRPNASGLKVGGHQASSASMVTIMTALRRGHSRLRPASLEARRPCRSQGAEDTFTAAPLKPMTSITSN